MGTQSDCIFPPGSRWRHTNHAYNNLGCRCDGCRTAHTDYTRLGQYGSYRRDQCKCGGLKSARSEMCKFCRVETEEAPHGSPGRFKKCPCDICRESSRFARAAHRSRLTDEQREAVRARDRARRRRKK